MLGPLWTAKALGSEHAISDGLPPTVLAGLARHASGTLTSRAVHTAAYSASSSAGSACTRAGVKTQLSPSLQVTL